MAEIGSREYLEEYVSEKVTNWINDIAKLPHMPHMLIPAITERKCNQLDRNILALPVRLGGLGLGNPSLEARREYAWSVKVTKPLVKQIVSQSHQLPEDPLTKLAQQEVRSERLKELEHRAERI